MVVEKMKLRILLAISRDLAIHVDSVFDELIQQRKTDYCLDRIIELYLTTFNKPLHFVNSSQKVAEIVETKRDIAFIFYCLSCPFYYNLGAEERLSKDKTRIAVDSLNISRAKFPTYIMSAKHYYRIYTDYKLKIDSFIQDYIKNL